MKTNFLKFALCLILCGLAFNQSNAQSYDAGVKSKKSEFKWPEGKKMALSLTFDDARLSQPDKGIPLLDKYNVKGTFYISPKATEQRLDKWKLAVANGHDIGNHSLVHPCTGNFLWSRDRALEDYTLEKMNAELDSASMIINKLLGIQPVSFAYPCGQSFVGRGTMLKSYIPLVATKFESGRGWLDEGPNDPGYCDMAQLTGMELDGKSFDQIKILIDQARNNGSWLVLAGHEMDDQGAQTSILATIEAICKYASDPANGIWIDNVHNIASYVKQKRGEASFRTKNGKKNK